MAMKRLMAAVAIAILATACSRKTMSCHRGIGGFDPAVSIDRVWSAGTKGGDDVLRLGLRPVVAGERAYVAGHGGDVHAVELATGRDLWRASTELELSGGPSVGEGIVVVGSSGGELIALDAETGVKHWQVATGGEVLTAPTVANGIVVVRTVDGACAACASRTAARPGITSNRSRGSHCAGMDRRSWTATW